MTLTSPNRRIDMFKFLAMGLRGAFTGHRDVLAKQTFASRIDGLKWASQVDGLCEIEWECSDGIWRGIDTKAKYQVVYYSNTSDGMAATTAVRSGADLIADLIADRPSGDTIGFAPVDKYEEI